MASTIAFNNNNNNDDESKMNNIVDDVNEKAMQVHPNVVISSKKVSPQVEEDKNKSEETKLIDRTEAQDNVIIQALQNNNVTLKKGRHNFLGKNINLL